MSWKNIESWFIRKVSTVHGKAGFELINFQGNKEKKIKHDHVIRKNWIMPAAYSGPCKRSKMQSFGKLVK